MQASQNAAQGFSAHLHAGFILGIEVLPGQIWMYEEDLEDVALDRVPAFFCQHGDDLLNALSEVVPVLYIGLIARKILYAQPLSQEDRSLDAACTLIFLKDVAEAAIRVISSHWIQAAEPRAEGVD